MSRVDIAELRRLHEAAAFASDEWDDSARDIYNASPALLDELEAARLEMRRQGSVIAECKEEVRRLTQANADLRKERDRAVKEAQRQDSVAKGLRKDRDALAADNARLRKALEKIRDRALPLGLDRGDSVTMLIAEEALAPTPDQSLAAYISSLHKSVDGPLPEIESITTTESEDLGTSLDEMAREIIQSNAAAATQKEDVHG